MFPKPLAFALVAVGCITAAGLGGYLATRHAVPAPPVSAAEAPSAGTAAPGQVTETEGVLAEAPPAASARKAAPTTSSSATSSSRSKATPAPSARRQSPPQRPAPAARETPTRQRETVPVAPAVVEEPSPSTSSDTFSSMPAPPTPAPIPREPERVFEELVVAADSVVGLQIESTVTSETARIEDKVDARVTRDVRVSNDVAIPAGSRLQGSVTLVERGGKVKERARLGVRFHTLVLADGTTIPLQTETIYREGDSPTGESSAKIGGAAIGGAIIGAILGGAKGAAIGGSAGAGAGTAAVMAGGRNPAVLQSGSTVTVRLSDPVKVTVER